MPAPEWGGSWSSPALNDGNVFVSSGKETNCINAETGAIVWTFTNPSKTASCNGGPAIAEGKVVCSDWDSHNYYCLNESTGNLLWTFRVAGYSQGTPAYDDGRFYLTAWSQNYLYCVDAETGEQVWSMTSGSGLLCGSASVSGDFVYATTYDFSCQGCTMYALSKEDGSVIWQQTTNPTDATPSVAYGNVYVSSGCKGYTDHITYCFNATTGEKIWETDPEDDIGGWTCSVAVADGKVFVGSESSGYFMYSRLTALDAETGGAILWYNNLGGATPSISDGMIFTVSDDHRLYAYGAPASAPTVDFTAYTTTGAAPFTVNFEDISTGFPTSWAWDLDGDGTVDSTKQDPEYTYETTGTYTVTLTVANGLGGDTITKEDFIEVIRPEPVADFTADAMSGKAPFTVTFTDLSIQSPTEWAWDFNGDGTVDSTEQNPVYTYETKGLYTVSLTATNDMGSDTITKEKYINVFTVGSGIEWQSYPGGTGTQDYLYSSCQADDGGYVSVGFTDSNDGGVEGNHGGTDVWVVKYDAGGNISWQKCLAVQDRIMDLVSVRHRMGGVCRWFPDTIRRWQCNG
ncbi:PQQ-binding-like beta-propeller repeat protein [Methanogenium cariaci]|uniref:outer membrane protein assembly factor BamB family protein n=1 Tax=Methanogenium cariaci TaxID=2197 RepID=UPI0024809DB7|nr:PQQ-binding-like beta-propeller repeat protein [Methanogenium cariaci]